MQREKLGSRIGFLLLSAGCAIGCGNVWKFPWLTGQNGGGGFVLIYIVFLLLLGLPVMIMEFAMGRASQASPVGMYQKLEKPGSKWHLHGYLALAGNVMLMAFYTVVTGWMFCYFYKFVMGQYEGLGFASLIQDTGMNVGSLALVVALGFLILSFNLQVGLERITKYMMAMLFILLGILSVRSMLLPGATEGLTFYLKPDFSKINGKVVVAAMNQAFFTLSLGIGSMAIFGSYIGKDHSLMEESVRVICLDFVAAIMAGLIIFPVCFTYNLEVDAGPALLFDTMATAFVHMQGGRFWGSAFFLFMVFAAMSTVLAVFENILACVRELTGWNRRKGSLVCGVGVFLISLTTALGGNVWSSFQPFGEGTSWLDLWDFCVSMNLLPIGSLIFAIFCCYRFGWGWDNFVKEANAGGGLKVKSWMRPLFQYIVPVVIVFIYIYGLVTFNWG